MILENLELAKHGTQITEWFYDVESITQIQHYNIVLRLSPFFSILPASPS